MGGETGRGLRKTGGGQDPGKEGGRGQGKEEGQGRERGKDQSLEKEGEGQDQMNTGDEGQKKGGQGQGIGNVLTGVDRETEKDGDDKNDTRNYCTILMCQYTFIFI